MELGDVIRRRRMCRSYTDLPVEAEVLNRLLDLARRAPSAGFSQGFSFLVLEGPEQTARFWDRTLPHDRRPGFPWPGLLNAPVLVLPLADPHAYVERYSQPDKARTGLGSSQEAWPIPYWFVDTAMATQNLLLAAVDEGLGALFFGIFEREEELLQDLGVPAGHRPIGAVALGHPSPGAMDRPQASAARRPRRPLDEVVHRGGWQQR